MLGQHTLQRTTLMLSIMLLGVIAASFFLAGCTAASKVYKVGILASTPDLDEAMSSFKTKMAALGYTEGQNISYELQRTNNDMTTAQALTKQLISDKVDLVYAFPAANAVGAKAATQGTNVPVVFAISTIEGSGLVSSVANPGGNITGVRYPLPELTAKRLELLLQIAPKTKRLWVAYQANYPPAVNALKELRPAAAAAGIMITEVPLQNLDELKTNLQARASTSDPGIDAIFSVPDSITPTSEGWAVLTAFASQHKIPILGLSSTQVRQGALFTYNPEYSTYGESAATLADKIFKGKPAGSIPVVTPYATLRINYAVAQQLGLIVPAGLLSQADEVVR